MPKLIMLGGPTGVGKSTTLKLLENKLPRSALLDADDVWRISDDLAVEGSRDIALSNIVGVLHGYVQAGCEVVILSWVFARSQLYEPVITGLNDTYDAIDQLYLVASPEALRHRLGTREDSHKLEYSITRLELIQQLPYPKIDTTDLSPTAAAEQVAGYIRSSG